MFPQEGQQELPLVHVLLDKGKVDEKTLLLALASRLRLNVHEQNGTPIPPEILAQISPALAMRHLIIPLGESAQGELRIACCDPFDWRGWDELSQVLGRRLEKVLCPRNVIRRMLKASYGVGADTVAVGELGLSGEIRRVPQLERRLLEASRLGFRRALIPVQGEVRAEGLSGMRLHRLESISAAIELCFN